MFPAFAYLDIEHPTVAWSAYRGVLVSAYAAPPAGSSPVSMMVAGMLLTRNASRLKNELQIELVRQLKHPYIPSRLGAMYFFDTEAQALRAVAEGWGDYFQPENLVEIELYETAPLARFDSNWITHAPLDVNGHLSSTEWVSNYWAGEPYPRAEPLWEILANGRAVICGTTLRQRAYELLKCRWPRSVALLEVARIAAQLGSDLGQLKAFLVPDEYGRLTLQFFIDMRDSDDESFLNRITCYDGPRNHADLSVGDESFYVPDLRHYGCSVSTDLLLPAGFTSRINSDVGA